NRSERLPRVCWTACRVWVISASTGVPWIGKKRIRCSGGGRGTTLPIRSSSVSDVRSVGVAGRNSARLVLIVTLSLRQRLPLRLRGEQDEHHADDVDARQQRVDLRVAPAQRREQALEVAQLQHADGGNDPPEVEAEPLARGPHPGGEQFGQVKGQPA